jgi:hypothetical protein
LFPRGHQLECSAFVFISDHPTQVVARRVGPRRPHIADRIHVAGGGEPGSVNICKLYCSSPVHFREPLTNHARCSSDKQCYNWASIPAREVRTCRGQTDVRLLCWRLLARAEPTENKRRAQSIISYSPLPRFFDFKTFNARIINGSTPFSISVFLLSSLMSTGTPLPS